MPNSVIQSPKGSLWMDTPQRYGMISRALHWGMATLLIWQFVSITCWRIFGRTETMLFISSITPSHGTVGILTISFVVVRFFWAMANCRTRPRYHRNFAGRVAHLGHIAFYMLMFAIPALGLLRSYGNGRGYNFWGLQLIPQGDRKIAWMIEPANTLHSVLAWALCALIIGHVGAALFHRFVKRDGIVARMAGPIRPAISG